MIVLYNLDYITGYTLCEFFLSYLIPGYRTLRGKVKRKINQYLKLVVEIVFIRVKFLTVNSLYWLLMGSLSIKYLAMWMQKNNLETSFILQWLLRSFYRHSLKANYFPPSIFLPSPPSNKESRPIPSVKWRLLITLLQSSNQYKLDGYV